VAEGDKEFTRKGTHHRYLPYLTDKTRAAEREEVSLGALIGKRRGQRERALEKRSLENLLGGK